MTKTLQARCIELPSMLWLLSMCVVTVLPEYITIYCIVVFLGFFKSLQSPYIIAAGHKNVHGVISIGINKQSTMRQLGDTEHSVGVESQ